MEVLSKFEPCGLSIVLCMVVLYVFLISFANEIKIPKSFDNVVLNDA